MADLSCGRNVIVVINFLGDTLLPDTYKHYDCSCEGWIVEGERFNSEAYF